MRFSLLFLAAFHLVGTSPVTGRASRLPIKVASIESNNYSSREFQYLVKIPFARENGGSDTTLAYLWIPPSCVQVRGLLLVQQNVAEQTIVEHPAIRRACAESDLAIVWFCPPFAPGLAHPERDDAVLQEALGQLASISGYGEIAQAPWMPVGHSACGFFAQRLAEYLPQRTLAVILFKGTLQPKLKKLRSIPLLNVKATFTEWDQDKRALPLSPVAPTSHFDQVQKERAVDGWPISLLLEYGSGHFECSDVESEAVGKYISKAAAWRLPQTVGEPLRPVDLNSGWVADFSGLPLGHRLGPAPATNASADLKNAPWYFDREMADTAVQLLPADWSRRQQFPALATSDGRLLPFVNRGLMQWHVIPSEEDGVSFYLKPTLLEALPTGFTNAGTQVSHAAAGWFNVARSCGNVEPAGLGRFRVALDRSYPRANWLVVRHSGDSQFRPSVQPVQFLLPLLESGKTNSIQFDPIADRPAGTVAVPLKAVSTSGLKVHFFVRAGPAVVCDNRLILRPIPLRSAYPVKVTVVAWQCGQQAEPAVQTASLVERTFLLLKPR